MSVAVQAEPVPPSFAADLVAGVSMAGLLLPEAVAYSGLAAYLRHVGGDPDAAEA